MSEQGQMSADIRGYCCRCGTVLSTQAARDVRGVLYCEPCLADSIARGSSAGAGPNPSAATFLGLVPGLGAVYNGEYFKALIHVLIFGGIISILSSGRAGDWEPLFGFSIPAFIIYMAIDANRVAKLKLSGQYAAAAADDSQRYVGPYLLIALGALFMLNNLGWLSIGKILDYGWPLAFILLGVHLLRKRTAGK
jgi:hypothetical protein